VCVCVCVCVCVSVCEGLRVCVCVGEFMVFKYNGATSVALIVRPLVAFF